MIEIEESTKVPFEGSIFKFQDINSIVHKEVSKIIHEEETVSNSDSSEDGTSEEIYIDDLSLHNINKYKDLLARKVYTDQITAISNEKAIKTNKVVSFSNVEVRYYPIILGDNPGSGYGAPVSISSDYFESATASIDHFEYHRKPRRTRQQLIKTHYSRKMLLKNIGYTEDEINERIREMRVIQKQRSASARSGIIYFAIQKIFKRKRKI